MMDIANVPSRSRETAYAKHIADAFGRPFAWGAHDCATFAAGAIKAKCGRDVLGTMTWRSALEAARLLEQMGWLRAAVTSRLGAPISLLNAHTGDPVLARDPDDGRELLAVFHGDVLLAPAEPGMAYLPLSHGICAWRAVP